MTFREGAYYAALIIILLMVALLVLWTIGQDLISIFVHGDDKSWNGW